MKAVQLLVNSHLPEDLRDYNRPLDSKGIGKLMATIGKEHPDDYERVSKAISDIGRNASYAQGETLHIGDLLPVIDRDAILADMREELKASRREDPKNFEENRLKIWQKYSDKIEKDTMKAALARGNNLAYSVASGARGKPPQLKAMISTPGLYTDYKDNVIPLFITQSFADGLRPAEFLAGAFGARKSVISTKSATARGGDFSKQMVQVGANTVVTSHDCKTNRGVLLPVDDGSMRGRILATETAGIPAGTMVDKRIMQKFAKDGLKQVVVRSAMTCDAHEGVCAKCIGGFYNGGKLPHIGDAVGITAAQALGEPVTQGALNCLAEGTLVRMADYSVRRIEEVELGEWVIGADLQGNTFPVEVTGVWDQGMQPAHAYTYKMAPTKQELEVVCTPIHELLQCTNYSNAKAEELNWKSRKLPAGLRAGKPAAVLPKAHAVSGGITEPFAKVLGFWMGDGIRTSQQGSLLISCACTKTIADLQDYLGLDFKINKCPASFDWRITQMNANAERLSGSGLRHPIKKAVARMGWHGLCCHEKTVPVEIWTWDQESVADFIAGFVAADGSVYRNKDLAPGIAFSSTSRPMLECLKELLAVRFCVYSTNITTIGRASCDSVRRHDQWQFTITRRDQVAKFSKEFSHRIPGFKGTKLVEFLGEAPASHFGHLPFYKAPRVKDTPVGMVHCWDLTVNHPDALFVLASGLIVSNTKHQGGMAKGQREYAGFDVINQIAQSPETFPDRAAVSELDGTVQEVQEAPQGGNYVVVDNHRHYVPQGYAVTVQPGDKVEAGDQLSDGIVDPGDIVRLKGLGEGRKFFAHRLKKAMDDSGMPNDLRNTEILARAAIDHMVVEDPEGIGPYMPDDVISYNTLQRQYVPPAETKRMKLAQAQNKYLQVPLLHYSIGTRITPKVIGTLSEAGIDEGHVSDEAPAMYPEMSRLRTAAHNNPDWLASMHTSYLKDQLNQAAVRGATTDVKENLHFAPRLAIGTGFGKNVHQTGKF